MVAFIENEARYEAGKARKIKLNRAKGGRARWFAAHEDAGLLHNWLFGCGEFEPHWDEDGRKLIRHPLFRYAETSFLLKMASAIDEWGGLADGQHAAVRRCYDAAIEKLATREQRIADQKAADCKTSHIGKVGERLTLTLKVDRVLAFDGHYGTTFFNICRDEAGNIVLYKGSNGWSQGDTVICKATIKAHDMRDGVPQTLIQRPTIIEVHEA